MPQGCGKLPCCASQKRRPPIPLFHEAAEQAAPVAPNSAEKVFTCFVNRLPLPLF